MAIYKSKYANYSILIKPEWVEIINGINKSVPPIIADFNNGLFNSAECPMVNSRQVTEKEVVDFMDKKADPKGDFWKVEDNKEAKKYERREKPAIHIESDR